MSPVAMPSLWAKFWKFGVFVLGVELLSSQIFELVSAGVAMAPDKPGNLSSDQSNNAQLSG
jgi:hypothetical protein